MRLFIKGGGTVTAFSTILAFTTTWNYEVITADWEDYWIFRFLLSLPSWLPRDRESRWVLCTTTLHAGPAVPLESKRRAMKERLARPEMDHL
jgi:hypothetical protein